LNLNFVCFPSLQHKPALEVNDLFEDIKDGVKLLALLEVLSGQRLVSPTVSLYTALKGRLLMCRSPAPVGQRSLQGVVDSDLHIVSPIGQSPGELQPAITHIGLCRFSSLTSSNICPTSLLATPECEHTRAVAGGTAEAASFNAANSTGVSSSLACPSL
jgi:hypothetical protein